MCFMSVTLDVSKLSSWLNLYVNCRIERGACDAGRDADTGRRGGIRSQARCGSEGGGNMGRRRRSGMHAGTRGGSDFGPGRAGGERTRNMPFMSVTLDVSKLSGLLNFFAFCMPDRN